MNTHSSERPSVKEIQWVNPATTLIRIQSVCDLTGLSRVAIYKRIATDPTFPRQVPLSDSKARGAPVGFVLAEVQAWCSARIAKRDQEAQA
ncbi:helix-turn-helix transcriptional regulator [Ectopseudomonas toyotomiensis]|uniref:helix-turn-helix transcriptional regulator n=1 Tax=Ectopseudomonas toyotomiensis TaxID=554344 RepID=UPI0037C919D8